MKDLVRDDITLLKVVDAASSSEDTTFVESGLHFHRIYSIRLNHLSEIGEPYTASNDLLERLANKKVVRLVSIKVEEILYLFFVSENISTLFGFISKPSERVK